MELYTTKEAAEQLGIQYRSILKAIDRGTLKAEKVGRDWLIEPGAIADYRAQYLGRRGRKPGRPGGE